jgi:glucokinase
MHTANAQKGCDFGVNNEAVEEFEKLLDHSSLGRQAQDASAALVKAAVERASQLEGSRYAVGIELLPFRLIGTVTNQDGKRLMDAHRRLDTMDIDHVIAAATDLVAGLISAAGLDDLPGRHIAVGLQLGGPVNTITGEVLFYHKSSPHDRLDKTGFTTWRNVPLGPKLAEATGRRVVIENDGSALAAYHLWFGVGRQHPTFALMLVREGVGGAYVEDGRLSRAPAEVGQINAQEFGLPCDCGRNGCVEAMAGLRGILLEIFRYSSRAVGGLNAAVALTQSSDSDVASKATMAFREAGNALAHGVGLMVNMFGGASRLVMCLPPLLAQPDTPASNEYLEQLHTWEKYTHSAYEGCQVLVVPLGPYDGAHGAALIALDRWFGMKPQTTVSAEGATQ